ncbi:MAG: ribonuclease III, partial [Synechococcaceae bacterium WB9_4xB_025]|nr:ribonuclease III [Synechococcaceae bacterium WB9_4xB_025]
MPKALPQQRLQQLQQLLRRIDIETSGLASTGWAAVDEAL